MKIKFFSKIEMTLLVVVIIFAATFTNAYAFNPVTPTNIRPADGETITTLTPTFEWSEFEDGDRDTQIGYHLRVRCDACDPNGKDTTAYDTGFIADTSANSHTYSVGAYSGVDPVTLHPLKSDPLEPNKQYHWHVRYLDSAGEWSDYSAEFPPYHYFYVAGFAPFPDDTVSLWHLDEIAGPDYVDAFDGNDGTGNTAPTSEAYGRVNWAQRFDGANTGIDVPEGWSFNWYDDSSFSIEFWVKTDGAVAPITNQVVIGRDDAATNLHWWVGLNKTDGLASFVLRDSGGNGPGSLLGVGTISLADGNWHHVVAVRDLGTGDNILYVDGNVQGRTNYDYPYTAWFGSNDAALNIGWLNLSHGYHFKGLIDEVAIYDRALTPTEIEDHYIAGVAGESIESLRPRPDAHAGVDQPNVKETTVVSLNGTASQAGYAESPIVYYLWVQFGGTPVTLSGATTATATFTAPDVSAAGETLSFRLTVTADDGQSNTDSVDIAVVNIVAPVANAGVDQIVTEGDPVTLDGSGSSDADGTIATYLWEQVTGTPVTLPGASTIPTATFNAPQVGPTGETLTFQLTVTDNDGLPHSDTMKVSVNDITVPVADPGDNQSVTEGDPVTLDGSGSSDADGTIATYLWEQVTGTPVTLPGVSTTPTATFAAPQVGSNGETLTFQLTVTDNDGLTNSDSMDVNVVDSLVAVDKIADFVTRFYRLILDREPDSLAQGWVDDLLSGRSAGCDIARGFVFSPEFINRNTSDEAYVDILYQAFFDRAADTAGKNGWLNVLQSGSPREDVLDGFLFSQEFANLAADFRITACAAGGTGGKSLGDFVTRFYRLILDREPDSLAQVWVDDLSSGTSTGRDIAFGFVFSPEFINRNTSDEAYVDILYLAFFNRAADTAGKNGWLNVLQSGAPRGEVLDGFIYSQEFADLCDVYRIIPFPIDPVPGSLQVTLKPQLAVDAGAGWNVDGGGWQASDVTISPLSVGDHRVSFKPISGWETPKEQTVTINLNKATIISGTYVKTTTGSLKVTIASGPPGAGWNVDGGGWQASGVTIPVSVGDHMVKFKPISGWDAPASKKVTITSNTIAQLAGEYKKQTTGGGDK